MFAGAAYLPIDIHNPRERVEKILRDSGTRIILVQNQAYDQDTEWLHEWDCISVSELKTDSEYKAQENKAGDLAYVIYTSGTTGMPKGVMITHHNAVNTILDINARYQITEQDTAFGISNLHFDLSVYDVFGILGAGGKLVLPDPEYGKDPAHWIHWLNHENITVWNSVPAFVEMLAEYEEYQRQVTSQSLRLVMMSGDWFLFHFWGESVICSRMLRLLLLEEQQKAVSGLIISRFQRLCRKIGRVFRMGNRLQTRSIMFWIRIWKIALTGYREHFILPEMALHRDI